MQIDIDKKKHTSEGGCETFHLACQRTQCEIHLGETVEGSGGAKTDDYEVGHSQIYQDVVKVGAQFLVLDSANDGQNIQGKAKDYSEQHEGRHTHKNAWGPQM